MSYVCLLAADKPLPLCDCARARTQTVRVGGTAHDVTLECGFRVMEHGYYRAAVDDLGFSIKPFRCELDLYQDERDLELLLRYLRENLSPGEEAELWGLWVGDEPRRLKRYRGPLDAFDLETMGMLEEWNVCLTVVRN